MGKQRTPQGQRPGRRMPVRRGPAEIAGLTASAETPAEAPTDLDTAPDPAVPEQETAPVEAAFADEVPADEAPAVTADAEPAPDAEPAAEPDAAPEAVAAPEEPAALGEVEWAPAGIVPEATAGIEAEDPAEQAASDEVRAEIPALDAALPDPLLPVAATGPVARAAAKPRPDQAAFRFAFVPARLDVEGIGVVLANYMHNESVAVFSHMRALSAARSPADMIRLNVTEMQRAADASLTCWSDIARRAARSVPLH